MEVEQFCGICRHAIKLAALASDANCRYRGNVRVPKRSSEPALLHDFLDRSLRELLAHPANLRDLLEAAVPDLADRFEWEHLEAIDRDFLLPDWRGRESDLLYRLPYRTADATQTLLVCLMLEHQSTADPRMPLRLLLYSV